MLFKMFFICISLCVLVGCESKNEAQPTPAASTQAINEDPQALARKLKIQQLSSELNDLEQQKGLLYQRLVGHEQSISSFETQINNTIGELNAFRGKTQAFIMDHKFATSCLAAAGMSLSADSHFSTDAEQLRDAYALFCAAALLGDGFPQEVATVADTLMQADLRLNNLQTQMKSLRAQMSGEREEMAKDNSEYVALGLKIKNLQAEIANVK